VICTQFINRKPASNLHHAIRIAEAIDRPLNVFVSFNFAHTTCIPGQTTKAFQLLRRKFSKWVTRPPVKSGYDSAPATFVWVLERPPHREHFNSHWLVHVPKVRLAEFNRKLPTWLSAVAGDINDVSAAIDVRNAPTPRGAGKYMLKGMHPGWAKHYDIRHQPQGVIEGRRSGFTKNIGPTKKRILRALDKYPQASPWIKGKYR
jgi:hypothetical protein